MPVRKITTPAVPEPPGGIFSNCLVVGDTVHISGQHAGNPAGGLLGDGSAEDQARQTFRKIVALVEAAGGTAADIVKLTIYALNMEDRAAIGRARKEFFSDPMPCSTFIGINALVAPDLLLEIDAVAILGAGKP
ncbi:RidA family protein [Pararoseomonas indoligenes]|uniref:RidA family protein n=1 Tax=Roseomonas indoligenes TaxID=2820811 RepID=A0A940S711_9PROT|nr:RidA family protein [Pararoseomonas indoligenes]MBP0494579.1 RidA family protein [Pararoseomonas indoligenes]